MTPWAGYKRWMEFMFYVTRLWLGVLNIQVLRNQTGENAENVYRVGYEECMYLMMFATF